GDIHATPAYRRHVAGVLVERAIMLALTRARAASGEGSGGGAAVTPGGAGRERSAGRPKPADPRGVTGGETSAEAPVPAAVRARVNGREYLESVPARLLLSDFLRHRLRLTGTHVGCEHGVCGACTVLMDGEAVRACLLLAAQADGAEILTVEGLEGDGG